ncbi:hypothetical protein E2C01_087801 [Portunus trituberculatus]|uniref:Uncharacterized protein n=1 Tax=Portunus trituberculatus TaxID=210409 RepID=A0A5B7JHG9_PORTR|nr:hypothetical protein [Portunus trituberculatus]
MTGMNRVMTV